MLIFLILLWLGIFLGDESYTLSNVTDLKIAYTQHYITCIFYMPSLCIIPTIGKITFFQILIISCIVGYVLAYIENKFRT